MTGALVETLSPNPSGIVAYLHRVTSVVKQSGSKIDTHWSSLIGMDYEKDVGRSTSFSTPGPPP